MRPAAARRWPSPPSRSSLLRLPCDSPFPTTAPPTMKTAFLTTLTLAALALTSAAQNKDKPAPKPAPEKPAQEKAAPEKEKPAAATATAPYKVGSTVDEKLTLTDL